MNYKKWYWMLVLFNIPFLAILIEELFFDNAIDWYHLDWLRLLLILGFNVCSIFMLEFDEEKIKELYYLLGSGVMSLAMWFFIFFLWK